MKSLSLFLFTSALACAADYTTGQAARLVIGQTTFTAADSTPSAAQVGAISGLAYANDTLFVVDGNRVQASPINNRVLIYRGILQFVLPPVVDIPQGSGCPVCAGGPDTKQADMVLGQSNFTNTAVAQGASGFRTPTAVATDGKILAVTDTDNNRVLIWNSIPSSNGQPADIVLGQTDFKTVRIPPVVDQKSFRGPQGVWIQGSRFFVADTQNHRVMVWNTIPTSNNQPADYVLGQPNFTTAPEQNLVQQKADALANNLLNPVSVSSDGTRLYISDLGHNRILIWNTIPTQTQQPADVAVGQPDLTSSISNNTPKMCVSTGVDASNNPTYPGRCGPTVSFPRYALSDGVRLYVADGGNDRILVFNKIPTQSGAKPDAILGQPDEFSDIVTDSTDTFFLDANITRSSADTIRTPLSLAWDGQNLYASDPFDMRVLVYTPGDAILPVNALTNTFSRTVFAIGTVDLSGTITEKDTVTVTVGGTNYLYTVVKADTLPAIVAALVKLINAPPGDPNVYAIGNPNFNEIVLSAKVGGMAGNSITLAVATSTGATVVATASGATLSRGNTAAEVAPGTLVSIFGTNLSDNTVSSTPGSDGFYPTSLGGVTVYFDGIKGHLFLVSPTQINTEVPFSAFDRSSVSAYVVTRHNDGFTTATTSVNVPIVLQNPGILAQDGQDPRPAIAFHTSSYSTAVVDIGGTIKSGDTGTITINGVAYTYTVASGDTIGSVQKGLIDLITADTSSPVGATAAGQYTRIILTAKLPGADGNGITVTVADNSGASLALTALQPATCCASVAGAPVTPDNPAAPGEIISIYATGIGLVTPDEAAKASVAGQIYIGPAQNSPVVPVDDAQLGGKTANVLNAGLKPGMVGVYEVQLQISPDLPDNDLTQLFIAQSTFTSNIVTIPVKSPPVQ